MCISIYYKQSVNLFCALFTAHKYLSVCLRHSISALISGTYVFKIQSGRFSRNLFAQFRFGLKFLKSNRQFIWRLTRFCIQISSATRSNPKYRWKRQMLQTRVVMINEICSLFLLFIFHSSHVFRDNYRPCRSSAVRRWLPTAASRVRVRAACGVCGAQSGTGAGFLRVLRFALPIIPPISPLS
jgi:hypothetical protein